MNTIHILPDTEFVSLVAGEDHVLILYTLDAAGALFQSLLALQGWDCHSVQIWSGVGTSSPSIHATLGTQASCALGTAAFISAEQPQQAELVSVAVRFSDIHFPLWLSFSSCIFLILSCKLLPS